MGFHGGSEKNPPAMRETWVLSLGLEDSLEEGMATHSCILAWRIPCTEEPADYSPWGHKEFDTTEQLSTDATILNLHVFSPVISFCIYWNPCIYTEDTAKSMHNCIIKKSCKLVRTRYNNREINCINWYSDKQYILENK